MSKIIPCKHGLPITKCIACSKTRARKYYKKHKERVKEYCREYYRTHYFAIEATRNRNIETFIKYYTKELNSLNAQIKREWVIPPIPLQGKQVELQNLIDNLIIIKDHTASLPKPIRAQARRRMMNELLSTAGRLVSWHKPLPKGVSINQSVNTSMKKE